MTPVIRIEEAITDLGIASWDKTWGWDRIFVISLEVIFNLKSNLKHYLCLLLGLKRKVGVGFSHH